MPGSEGTWILRFFPASQVALPDSSWKMTHCRQEDRWILLLHAGWLLIIVQPLPMGVPAQAPSAARLLR
jgi:hypothetical protein